MVPDELEAWAERSTSPGPPHTTATLEEATWKNVEQVVSSRKAVLRPLRPLRPMAVGTFSVLSVSLPPLLLSPRRDPWLVGSAHSWASSRTIHISVSPAMTGTVSRAI